MKTEKCQTIINKETGKVLKSIFIVFAILFFSFRIGGDLHSINLSDIEIFNNSEGYSIGVWSKNGELVPSNIMFQELNALITSDYSSEWKYYFYTSNNRYYIDMNEVFLHYQIKNLCFQNGRGIECYIWKSFTMILDEFFLWDRSLDDVDLLYWFNEGKGRGIYEDLCFVEGRGIKCYQYNFDMEKLNKTFSILKTQIKNGK